MPLTKAIIIPAKPLNLEHLPGIFLIAPDLKWMLYENRSDGATGTLREKVLREFSVISC